MQNIAAHDAIDSSSVNMGDTNRVTIEDQQKKWKNCDERYVRNDHFWRWIVGAISGSVVLIGTLVFTLTRWGASMEKEDAIINMRVNRCEETQIRISTAIHNQDTIKTLIRELRK